MKERKESRESTRKCELVSVVQLPHHANEWIDAHTTCGQTAHQALSKGTAQGRAVRQGTRNEQDLLVLRRGLRHHELAAHPNLDLVP